MSNRPDVIQLHVEQAGERLDRYVSDRLPGLSRSSVQRLIEQGNILVDGRQLKSSYHVQSGESISVRIPPPVAAATLPEAIPLKIVYEDGDLLVVDKPPGMVVHPAAGHPSGTLVNAVLAHAPGLNVGGVGRPGIVHRLDRDTSGLIVVAKNDAALRNLQAQWKSRSVHKVYLALVVGHVRPPRGRIEAPVGRNPKHRQRMAIVTRESREAITVYRTLAYIRDYTLLQAEPETGRTHQIRVHLAFLGFPVVGDSTYGSKKNDLDLQRQFLHAWKIRFKLPRDGRQVEFAAPLPNDLHEALIGLGFDPEEVMTRLS